ncbi:MAG: hypothetical protein R6V44_03530 [Paracoccaceae bacterium]
MLGLFLFLAGPAVGASFDLLASAPPRGPALAQSFLSDTISRLDTPSGAACVASAPIAVAASRYSDPGGVDVAFDAVRRSRAASVQLLHPLDARRPALRVQLKYPVDRSRPIRIETGGVALDVRRFLEPTGDSLRIADPGALARLRQALGPGGPGARVVGVSEDTGRRIEDRLPHLDLPGLAGCLAGGAVASRTPRELLTVEFEAAPTRETRLAPAEARACAMGEARGPVHRGRLLRTTGFFAQTRSVHVVFGPGGVPELVHVPGVFDAAPARGGAEDPLGFETPFAADVSIAADRNDPLAAAVAKGCLGMSQTALCLRPAGAGRHALGPCVAAQPLPTRPSGLAAPAPAPAANPLARTGDMGRGAVADPPFRDRSLGEGPREPLDLPSGFRIGSLIEGVVPSEPPPLATPLPAAGLLFAAALAALFLRRR